MQLAGQPKALHCTLAAKGRGAELSDLQVFDGKVRWFASLLACMLACLHAG